MIPDGDPDPSYLEQEGFEDRLAEYHNGDFVYIGVRAAVQIHDWTKGAHVTVESAGLWGIESDSGREYLMEVGREELDALKDELAARNIDISGVEPQLVERP